MNKSITQNLPLTLLFFPMDINTREQFISALVRSLLYNQELTRRNKRVYVQIKIMQVHVGVYIQVCVHSHSRNVTLNFYKMVFKLRPHIIVWQLDLDPNNRFRTLSLQIKSSQEETSVSVQRKSKCNSLYPTQNTASG